MNKLNKIFMVGYLVIVASIIVHLTGLWVGNPIILFAVLAPFHALIEADKQRFKAPMIIWNDVKENPDG